MKTPIICQLSDFSPEYSGSFVDSLLCLARHCHGTIGIETLCVFPEQARKRKWLERFDSEGVKYNFVPRKKNIIVPLLQVLADYEPVIFHSHFQTFDLGAMFLKLTVYKNAKLVWHLHSIAELTLRQQIKDAIKVRVLARNFGDLFIAVGDSAYNRAIGRGFPRERLILNYNGINVSRFSSNHRRDGNLFHPCDVPGKGASFLLLGYNPLIKGVDLFVKAAEKLFAESPNDSRFSIVGRKETREFVSQMPEFSHMDGALQLLAPVEDFPHLLSGIDVLVVASRTEGLSYAVLEAMAAEKLVLSSDIPGVRDTYGKSEGVWLFPTEDWQALTDLMRTVNILTPGERERLGQTNAQYVRRHHSLDLWARRATEAYRALLDN